MKTLAKRLKELRQQSNKTLLIESSIRGVK